MRMYGSGQRAFFTEFLQGSNYFRDMFRSRTRQRDPTFVLPKAGCDPYNHQGRFMKPEVATWRQTNYTFAIDFSAIEARTFAYFGRDPRNHRGHLL